MAQRVEVDLIVEAISKGFQNVNRDLERVERGQKSLDRTQQQSGSVLSKVQDNWQAVVLGMGAAAGAIATVKKAWEFSKEGAQIAKVRDTFDSLTVSIGETSTAVLKDLRAATANMVADTELMMSANRFFSMGLAQTGDEASELARIAVTLGGAMGKEATPAMEEFALLLANQSIPRLDTFGISAGRVRERIKELQDQTPGLSRETAFMTAVMEEAQISMEKLGGDVPVDAFTQFEVQTKNLTDELKLMAAEGLGPVVDILAKAAIAERENYDLVEELLKAVDDGIITLEEFNAAYDDVEEGTNNNTAALQKLADQANETRQELAQLNHELYVVGDTGAHYSDALERAAEATSALNEGLEIVHRGTIESTRAAQAFGRAWAGAAEANRGTPFDFGAGFRTGLANLNLLNEDLDDLGQFMVTVGGRTADQNKILSEAETRYKRLGEEITKVSLAPELFGLNSEEAAERLQELTEEQQELIPLMERMGSVTGTASLATKEATANVDVMKSTFFEMAQQLDLTDEELLALGMSLGIYNQQQADAIVKAWQMHDGLVEIRNALDEGNITISEATRLIEELGANGIEAMRGLMSQFTWTAEQAAALTEKIKAIGAAIDNLPDEKQIQIRTVFSDPGAAGYTHSGGDVFNPPSSGGDGGGGGGGGTGSTPPEYQHGGHFIVPAGGPYPMVVHPGEEVRVTPRNQVGRMTGNVTFNVYPQTPMDVERAIERGLQQAGLSANRIKRTM